MGKGSSINPDELKKTQWSELEKMKRQGFWLRRWSFIDVTTLCWFTCIHVLAACAPFFFNWEAFVVTLGLTLLTGIGMTLGYHRLLTHRSFKIPKWLEYFFVYCGVPAGQKDPISWASIHKYHHKYAETDRDPHSPSEGFWFSHIGWFCYNDYVVAKSGESRNGKYANVTDLKAQRFYRILHDTYFLHPTALAVLLYLHGGFPYLAWAVGIRTVTVCHITFVVAMISDYENGYLSNLELLEIIDSIERLGFGYRFQINIRVLDKIAKISENNFGIEEIEDELHVVSLNFRLLQQHHYNKTINSRASHQMKVMNALICCKCSELTSSHLLSLLFIILKINARVETITKDDT